MSILIPIAIFSLTIVIIIAGLWLSLPASVPLAPPQSFIDALPSWMQGPRRRPSFTPEPLTPAQHDEPPVALMSPVQSALLFKEIDTALQDRLRMAAVHEEKAPVTEDSAPAEAHDEQQSEAAPVEVVHDEP